MQLLNDINELGLYNSYPQPNHPPPLRRAQLYATNTIVEHGDAMETDRHGLGAPTPQ